MRMFKREREMKGQVARGHSVHFRVEDLGDPSYAATNNVKPFSITGYLLCLYSIFFVDSLH